MLKASNDYQYFGFYRAKVLDNRDPEKRGQILVWIPDLMALLPETGIWALPCNNPLGGRNPDDERSWKQGSCHIPVVGSWVWVFFEGGDPSRPFYLAGVDIEQSHVVAECQLGNEYWNKWVPLRSPKGRVIVISDDPDDERVELTGKKRQEANKIDGDTSAVYTIDGNQTVILIDERDGKEKVLIKDYKGNTILVLTHLDEIHIYANSDIVVHSGNQIHVKTANDMVFEVGGTLNIKVSGDMHVKVSGEYHLDASHVHNQDGTANPVSAKLVKTGRDD